MARRISCRVVSVLAITLSLVILHRLGTEQWTLQHIDSHVGARQLEEYRSDSSLNSKEKTEVTAERKSQDKSANRNKKRKKKVLPETCGCLEDTMECHSKRLNMSVREYCFRSPRRYDCSNVIMEECKSQRSDCMPTKRKDLRIFDEVDCYDLTNNCFEQKTKANCEDYAWACTDSSKVDVMLGVLLDDRLGSTKFTASVIKDIHKFNSKNIYIFNTNKHKFNENILRNWYGDDITVVLLNRDSSSIVLVRSVLKSFLSSKHGGLFLIDSATVFHPNSHDFISSNIKTNAADFISLYHSSAMHSYKEDCPKIVDDLCEGAIHSDMGVVITRKFAKVVLRYIAKSEDLNFVLDWESMLRKEGMPARYPRKSLTMNIRQSNQDNSHCGDNEVPYRFDKCSFPSWVRDGIEFYFDRCTNPDEEFVPGYSIPRVENERRPWARPAISYTLYGDEHRYIDVALENAARVFSIYPGWKIWLYTDNTTPKNTISQLCEYDIRMVDMSLSRISCKRSWRYLVASEPVKMFAVRDIDSWLIPRGKAAVDEWIQSGRKFHVMRDHPKHSVMAMNAGMWGGTTDAYQEMKNLLECMKMRDFKYQDSAVLIRHVWNVAKKSVWVQDSHPLKDFGEYHPFPVESQGKGDFVGRVVPWRHKQQET